MAAAVNSPAIGIDLGTTYSCVGVYRNGQVQIIENDHGNRTTPSCVVFDESQRLIGDAAKNMMAVNPLNTVYNVKRLIGRRFDDPFVQSDLQNFPFTVIYDEGKLKIQVEYKGETKTFFPEEISAMILFKMKETAEAHLGESVTDAVVSVPAYFNDAQRRATKDAGTIAGLRVQLINEPTAAALAYGYRFKDDGKIRNILIFDLGGGTVDVSLLTIDDGTFVVRSTSGSSHLGGEDFNNRLVKHFINEFKKKYKKDVSNDKRALSSLQTACEKAKRCLSSTTQTSIAIDSFYEGIDFYSSISRARFEEINEDLFESAIELVEKTILDGKINKKDVDEVILVGGSTRIPMIRNLLQDVFNGKELSKTVNPDEVVAHGAAVQAAILNGDRSEAIQNLSLYEVAPFTIGLWSGAVMDRIIERNTLIPVQVKQTLRISRDNKTSSIFRVYEIDGPDTIRDAKQLLGRFELDLFSAAPLNSKVDVTFNIHEDGIFNITAVPRGFWSDITITSDEYRLTQEEMDRMIADAKRYRLDDLEHQERATARNDLESFCSDAKSRIERVNHHLKESFLEWIEQTIQWLENGPLASVEAMDAKKENIEYMLNTILSDTQNSSEEEVPISSGKRSKYCLYYDH